MTKRLQSLYPEHIFHSILDTEIKRTERSMRPFVLVLVRIDRMLKKHKELLPGRREYIRVIEQLCTTITESTRDIDSRGWYTKGRTIGIICVELNGDHRDSVHRKLRQQIDTALDPAIAQLISIETRLFPDSRRNNMPESEKQQSPSDVLETPITDIVSEQPASRRLPARFSKRTLDIIGATIGLILFAPFFLLIPLLIKVTSSGPVFFKQKRVGRNGNVFTFYKFRSMYCNNDDSIHKQFVSKLIRGEIPKDGEGSPVFKIKNDPRVTPIGRILRKTSLDELPQFINVLMGNMSLVGPRPAIPYEVREYSIWHCRRILRCKPGITGFWQVEGRSSTTFENMVRMDIRYVKQWSLWLDLKLLIKTPLSVLGAKGAC